MKSRLGLSDQQLIDMYRMMLLIRRFEEKVGELYSKGVVPGFPHLYVGEEAVAVGSCANLTKEDFMAIAHRPHGYLLAKGSSPNLVMAEIFGRRTGYCKDKGGSMHVTDMENHVIPSAIVGAGIPIAAGAALAFQLRKENAVALSFFGDGASNTGVFHEALNMASVWKLPVIFICENNLYAISVPSAKSTSVSNISDRAHAYNIPGESIDGNDVIQVYSSVNAAIKRAKSGQGPTLIECKTYRLHGHHEGDPHLRYRTKTEIEEWKAKCPIKRLERTLLDRNILNSDRIDQISREVDTIVNESVKFAQESPLTDPAEIETDIFGKGLS